MTQPVKKYLVCQTDVVFDLVTRSSFGDSWIWSPSPVSAPEVHLAFRQGEGAFDTFEKAQEEALRRLGKQLEAARKQKTERETELRKAQERLNEAAVCVKMIATRFYEVAAMADPAD